MRPSLLLCSIAAILIQSHGCKASGQKSEPGMLFTRHPQPFVAPLGDAIDFECSLNLAAEKFIWRHRPLNSNKWLILDSGFSGAGKTSKYVVNFDNEAKAGDYRCVAFYGTSGLASDPARLTQARIDNFSDDEDVFLRISPGNNVPIVCPVPYSMPEAVIQFYKDGNPIQYASLAGSKTMLIEKAKPSNSGFYHCLANNYITSETYASNYKTVLNIDKNLTDQAPYFINKPQTEYKVLRGHNVTLGCLAVGNPVPQVKWTKLEGNQIGNLPIRSSYSPMGLTIYSLQPSDKGEYECMWSNRVSRIKAIISLTVVEPPSVLKPPKLSTFPEGGELELSCNTTGYPAPQVEWLINGETLLPNKNVHTKGSTLFISLVEKKHAGIVQCVASNEYGSQSGYNMLRVSPKQHVGGTKTRVEYGMGNSGHKHTRGGGRRRGKDGRRKGDKAVLVPPDQPNVTRLSDYSVMVRWNVPENHGLPIQFFKVQYREIGNQRPNGKQAKWMTANTEIPSHVRSFEVADLTPNHTYKFRIAAVYSNNDNMVSQISSKFLLNHDEGFESNRMPIPLLTNTEALSPSEVLLIWQNPDKSQNIDGFYVYHRASTSAGDYIKTTVEGKFSTNITISHLQPDTTYEFKVQSFSVDAASEFSQILRQRTKKVVTEVPPIEQNLPENNNVNTVENAKNSNIYAIIGGIFGGTVLLIGLAAVGLAYKRKKTKQNRETTPTPGKPMTNGRIMNGGITDSKMNITSNPLAGLESTEDPMQPKNGHQSPMEMASFFNGQNNNGSCCLPNPQQDINSVGLPPVSGVVVNSMQGDLPPTVLMQGPRPIEQPL